MCSCLLNTCGVTYLWVIVMYFFNFCDPWHIVFFCIMLSSDVFIFCTCFYAPSTHTYTIVSLLCLFCYMLYFVALFLLNVFRTLFVHSFLSSVAVSAKNSDGGVDKAIQALIRHLLERKLKDKALQKMEAVEVRRRKKKKTKPKKVNPDDFQPLEKTDIEEVNDHFNGM